MTEERRERRAIRVVALYPDVMNVYADRGNLTALRERAETRDIDIELTAVGLDAPLPADADLVLIGGGQDAEQLRIARDLAAKGETIRRWVDDGTAVLAICGGFQLFGHSYRAADGTEIPGIAVFDVTTVAPPPGWQRCIGDVLADCVLPEVGEVVGFENHGGRTYLGPEAQPLATVRFGFGNNGDDSTEGAVRREAIGTYLHGPVLPKNPALADRLLLAAVRHRYGEGATLEPVDAAEDRWARAAHQSAARTARARGWRRT